MNKFWMMGGTVIAASVAALAWNSGPVRSSENLLGKAQSEFATKARDALIQRQMRQATTVSAAIAAPKSETPAPYVVASLGPVAAPTVVARETRVETAAPAPQIVPAPQAAAEPQPVTAPSPDAPIASQAAVASPATVSAPAAEDTPATKTQMAALPEVPLVSAGPKWIPAGASELAKTDTPVVTPTDVAPRRQFKAERKPRHVRQERKSNAVASRSERSYSSERPYRSERAAPRYLTPYNLNTLRARSPELAAAIARYL